MGLRWTIYDIDWLCLTLVPSHGPRIFHEIRSVPAEEILKLLGRINPHQVGVGRLHNLRVWADRHMARASLKDASARSGPVVGRVTNETPFPAPFGLSLWMQQPSQCVVAS